MTSNEEFLFQKIWKMSEEESAGTHYNEKDLTRRLATYNSYQNNQNGQLILSDFWSENDIPMTSIPIDQDLKVLDLLKLLNEYRMQCQKTGKYGDADKARNKFALVR